MTSEKLDDVFLWRLLIMKRDAKISYSECIVFFWTHKLEAWISSFEVVILSWIVLIKDWTILKTSIFFKIQSK